MHLPLAHPHASADACVFHWSGCSKSTVSLVFNLTFPTAVGGDLVKMYYAGKPTRQYAQSFAATSWIAIRGCLP